VDVEDIANIADMLKFVSANAMQIGARLRAKRMP